MTKKIFDKAFLNYFWTQFLGAFNDNLFKNALVILITYQSYTLMNLSTEQVVALCGGIFILPFFLFSAWAGAITDKFSKSQLMRKIKLAEIFIMLVGALGLLLDQLELLLLTLFLMGTQSSFFGPLKYSLLPEIIDPEQLLKGNAWVQLGTFVAILLGTLVGGLVIAFPDYGTALCGLLVILIALMGAYTAYQVPDQKGSNPDLLLKKNPLSAFIDLFKMMNHNHKVWVGILAISWFWFFGAALLSLFPLYVKDVLKGDESVATLFLTFFSLGVGLGAIFCGRWTLAENKKVTLGLIGMVIGLFDLFYLGSLGQVDHSLKNFQQFLAGTGSFRILFDFFFISFCGGLFIVPFYVLIQSKTDQASRSRVIAVNNILNALFMVFAAVLLTLLFSWNFSHAQVFLCLSASALLVLVALLFFPNILKK